MKAGAAKPALDSAQDAVLSAKVNVDEHLSSQSLLQPGMIVRISGLVSEAGEKMNGLLAQVESAVDEDAGRVKVTLTSTHIISEVDAFPAVGEQVFGACLQGGDLPDLPEARTAVRLKTDNLKVLPQTVFHKKARVHMKTLSKAERKAFFKVYSGGGHESEDEDESLNDDLLKLNVDPGGGGIAIPEWKCRGYESLEEACDEEYNGACSAAEEEWDNSGIPRIVCLETTGDSLMLNYGGFECQGYKPGRSFVLSMDSLKVGERLVFFKGQFYEEPPAGWSAKVQPSGRVAYVNESTKQMRWQRPDRC